MKLFDLGLIVKIPLRFIVVGRGDILLILKCLNILYILYAYITFGKTYLSNFVGISLILPRAVESTILYKKANYKTKNK